MSRNAIKSGLIRWRAVFGFAGLVAGALRGLHAAEPPTAAPPSRVVVVEHAAALQTFAPQVPVVQWMVEEGLKRYCRKPDVKSAWLSLVSTNDVVGIKIFAVPGPSSGTRPAVVEAIVRTLVGAGIPARQIVIWDRDMAPLILGGFADLGKRLGVEVRASADAGYDEAHFYENPILGNLVYGDLEFGRKGEKVGRRSFVSKLVTSRLTKIISVAPLLNHNAAGVTGHLYSLTMGSVDNTLRFDGAPPRLATAIPELWAVPALGDHVVLNVTDALLAQYEGETRSLLHYSHPLNQLWLSADPVALDSLAVEELKRWRQSSGPGSPVKENGDLFENAVLLDLGHTDRSQIRIERIPETQSRQQN